jgi:hypothetical protein
VKAARATRGVPPGIWRAPDLSSGSVEALKWLGLALMVVDHTNKYLYHGHVRWMFDAGRVVMPIFGIVLAWNLARGDEATAWRAVRRMLIFAGLASPAFMGMQQGRWWPLNILFTLATSAAVIALLQRGRKGLVPALALAAPAGVLVEFWWPAIGATVAAWYWWRAPSWRPALAWMLSMALLVPINGNAWAFTALPIVLIASRLDLVVPRLRWVFYAAYPLHLFILWSLQ